MLSTFLFLATCLQKLKYPELIPVTYPQARDLEWHKPQFAQTAQQRTIELQHWTAFEVENPDGTSVTVAVPPPPPVPTFVCAPVAGEVMQVGQLEDTCKQCGTELQALTGTDIAI